MGYLTGKKPPFLIMHGSADTLVSPQQSAQLYTALKKAGAPVEYLLVDGEEHGDIHWFQPEIINKVVTWFSQKLGKPTPKEPRGKASANDQL